MSAPNNQPIPIQDQYPKLVRDKIPEIIRQNGGDPVIHIAGIEEYNAFLLAKLLEEATELKEAEGREHIIEELADVYEVLQALLAALDISEDQIDNVQKAKRSVRGGFGERIILDQNP